MKTLREWSRSCSVYWAAMAAFCCLSFATPSLRADALALNGSWRFELDRQDVGTNQQWFMRPLDGNINLPGALQNQGFGDDISPSTDWTAGINDRSWFTAPEAARYREPGNVKVPFWLQPEKHYVGVAWYQREVSIPAGWRGKNIRLCLERPHWETRVWVDETFVGSNNSLSVPHEYNFGTLKPGKHRLTIRVDNRLVVNVGMNSHSVSDHTQGNWNGIVGAIELQALPSASIDDLQVYPSVARKSVLIKGRIANLKPNDKLNLVTLSVRSTASQYSQKAIRQIFWDNNGAYFETELFLGADAPLWDEFNPALFRLTASLGEDGHSKTVSFGLRELSTDDTQFVLNGTKTFIRGTLECCIFPKTGYPPTDVDSWKRIIRIAKNYGLNSIRFHSWCPPEAAFVAADELGFYYQVECASWANSDSSLGDGLPIDSWLYDEGHRILKAYGNHPSFMLMLYGNEPGGKKHKEYLAKWVTHFKQTDSRRLYSSGAGWPQLAENQFHVTPEPRIQLWGAGLQSRINSNPPETRTDYCDYIQKRSVPVISHEIGQWCVYPNFDEIAKYTGPLKAKNFEIFRDSLNEHGMGSQARQFLYASGKLQVLCYKEDIESALRTRGMGGFQLLDLHDFPGQGTALVGVLDPFWDEKGYVTGKEYSRFCNATVPLARMSKRVWTSDECLAADLEVAHFGPAQLRHAIPVWKIVNAASKTVITGEMPPRDIPVDNGIALGSIKVDLSTLKTPQQYKLVVGLQGTPFENDWDIWVYPPQQKVSPSTEIVIVNELNEKAVSALDAGGKVLLTIPPDRVKSDKNGKIAAGFSSIFWNTAWTRKQPPHTLGILCDPKHPALAEFPTEAYSNWQWWYLIGQCQPMILDGLNVEPIVQVIDDWVTNRKLGLVFEARVAKGKLLVCSIDLEKNRDSNPVASQLLRSLLGYMQSAEFQPTVTLTSETVSNLIAPPTASQKLGLQVIRPDSVQGGYPAENVLDGNPETIWHTKFGDDSSGFPHWLQLDFAKPVKLRGFAVLPRQDGNRNGLIKQYTFQVSSDGRRWSKPIAEGSWKRDAERKVVELKQPCEARHIKFTAISGFDDKPYASLAEMELLPAE